MGYASERTSDRFRRNAMPTRMALWKISTDGPAKLPPARLEVESRLEDWIASDPGILGLDLLIIGRQVVTAFGGKIDLLGINRDGDLVIVELKRDKTPREVVAQVLDYASWVKGFTAKDIDDIASDYLTVSLDAAFSERFGIALPESPNANHSMLIVASELDDSSERIVNYLVDQYGVNINAIFFNFFSDAGNEFLGRSWLANPENVSKTSAGRKQPPWSGYWYVNVDEGSSRSWDDCKEYGFISAGGDRKYSDPLKRLGIGEKLFAYQKGLGYVGFGIVSSTPVMGKEFLVESRGARLFDLPLKQPDMKHDSDDPDISEWVVGIKWVKSVPREKAKKFPGIFANQNVVCKLRDEKTLKFLTREFEALEEEQGDR